MFAGLNAENFVHTLPRIPRGSSPSTPLARYPGWKEVVRGG